MGALGIDVKLLIAQIVNFAIFFWLIKKFVAQPFLAYMSNQKKMADERDLLLKTLEKKEKEIEVKREEIIKKARQEALKLLQDAKRDIERMREEQLQKVHEEITSIKAKMDKQIEEDKKNMVREVRKYIIETSSSLVKKALANYLDETKQQEVLEYVIRQTHKN